MQRALSVVAALLASGPALPQTNTPYPFEGKWSCGGMSFSFTGRTFDQGNGPQQIQRVQLVKAGDYRLSFKGSSALFLRVLSPSEMRWISEASGDSFECTREEPTSVATAPIEGPIFAIIDAESLMEKLRAATPEKSQFETTPAFEERRMQALAPMLRVPPARESWYQVIEPRHVRYDADAGSIKFPSFLLRSVTLSELESIEGQYAASNAFGAEADVTRRKIVRKTLEWDARFQHDIAIRLPVSEVEPQWQNLRIIVLASVGFLPVKEEQHTSMPKFDSPYEDRVVKYTMAYRADRIAVMNIQTKAILANLPFVFCREQFGGGTIRPGRC